MVENSARDAYDAWRGQGPYSWYLAYDPWATRIQNGELPTPRSNRYLVRRGVRRPEWTVGRLVGVLMIGGVLGAIITRLVFEVSSVC